MLVCHMTAVHSRYDIRIFKKECVSLAGAGYSVCLLVADGAGDEVRDGVEIRDIGKFAGSRFSRMATASRRFLKECLAVDAELYHLHDPELIPCGLKLKRKGRRVVYDIHEDVPRQLASKPYLNPVAARALALGFESYENFAASRFDALIAATPFIRGRFEKLNRLVVDINNYPIPNELLADRRQPWSDKKPQACYVGALTSIRGLREMVEAARFLSHGTILLAGRFEPQSLEDQFARDRPKNLEYVGFVYRDQVAQILDESMVGLVVFHPAPNHLNAQPNKLFEYMSAGIPVIASAFPTWDRVIRDADCGILVDPLDPAEIARAVEWVFAHPAEAESKGSNGRRAVERKYNWGAEEQKLVEIYSHLVRG